MEDKIQEGNIVDVIFEAAQCEFNMKVLYTPQATGDSWQLQRQDGTMVYVQLFAKMIKK